MARRITIFFSWQSDSPRSTNHSFIEDCLERAVKELKRDEELKVEPVLDRDTQGVPGSPDIVSTILDKIKNSQIFVGDVSIINPGGPGRATPNPNVLIELGYALACLGHERIVCVCNEVSGTIEDLPFDLRQKRVCKYRLEQGQDKGEIRKTLVSVLRNAIRLILDTPDTAAVAAEGDFLGQLASVLADVLIFSDQMEERSINPWADAFDAVFQHAATELRTLALGEIAVRRGLVASLEELADACDEIASFQMYMGAAEQHEGLVSEASRKAAALKAAHIDSIPLSADSLVGARVALRQSERRLQALAERAERMLDQGRLDDLRHEASQIGLVLLRLGHHDIDSIRAGLGRELRELGRDLHVVETMPVYADGGISVQAIIDSIRQGRDRLSALASAITVSQQQERA